MAYHGDVRALKYQAEFVQFNLTGKCPPASAVEMTRTAYRYVWNPIGQESFVPVALMPNKRANRKNPNKKPKCGDLGLSMFLTEEQARARFAELIESFTSFRETTGSHLARVHLLPDHGRQELPGDNGHFNLHEYVDSDLTTCCDLVGAL